jgi:alanine dehydrogenase
MLNRLLLSMVLCTIVWRTCRVLVARTSTVALTNATLPYAVQIANKGWKKAMQENPEIRLGANVISGKITYKAVAEAFALDYTPVDQFL